MAAYKDLVGQKITKVTSNPSEPKTGQMWYNSTAGKIRALGVVEAWSSQGALLEARSSGAGFGVSTAAVYAGGQQPPGPGAANTFEYNGSGWSTGGDLNTARMELGGTTAGIETAGLCFGGNTAPGWNGTGATEEYNGTAWTSVNNMATTVSSMGGSGIQTAAFSAGGRTPSNTNNSQEYDGTNWTNGNNINTTRQFLAGMGTQTAGIIAGGESPSGGTNSAETYDGTNFTAAPNMGTARYRLSGSGSDSTACLVFGGRFNPPAADKAQTESFDGTSWTEKADLATARQQLSGNRGTSSSAIAAGGLPPPAAQTTDTEEFNISTNTITGAAWASGNNLGTARNRLGGAGTQTAGLAFGGSVSPGSGEPTVANLSEEYDGSSWTEGNNLGTSRYGVQGCGIQTAALAVGGVVNPNSAPGATRDTEEYDGTSWTAQPDTSNNFYLDGVAGTQTAAVTRSGAGGPPGPAGNYTEEYNGSSWTTNPGTIGTARYAGSFIGTQTAAIYCGGQPPAPVGFLSDTYDGSSFSSAPSLVVQFARGGGAGTQTNALIFGPSTASVVTQQYNGTSWVTSVNNATERNSIAGSPAATASAALMSGGGPGVKNNTEEFTGETSAANIADFTTS